MSRFLLLGAKIQIALTTTKRRLSKHIKIGSIGQCKNRIVQIQSLYCIGMCISVVVSLIICAITTYFFYLVKKPPNYPPGPPWMPIVGNGPLLRKLSKSLGGQHLAFEKLSKEYNTEVLGLKLGGEYVVVATSYQTVKALQLSEEYDGRPKNFFIKLRSAFTEKGITGTDGEFWRIQRNFVKVHLRKLGLGKKTMEFKVQEEVSEILNLLDSKKGEPIQMNTILSISTLNVLWAFTSGSRLKHDDPQLTELLYLLTIRSDAFDIAGGLLNQFPWLRLIAPEKSGYNLLVNINEGLRGLIKKTIEEHHENWSDGRDDDLIFSFITEMKKDEGKETTFTDDQLIMVCLDLFLAGSMTTSSTINFAMMMMIEHPDIQNKVRSCLLEEFGKTGEINYSDKNRVPYVEAVILEVERLLLVVPVSGPRRVARDTELGGYRIPKNTTVLISLYSSHSNEQFWKDPKVFRPERFLDENGKLSVPDRFMPFGLGKRRCVGEILAKTAIFSFFCGIMRSYEITLAANSKISTGKLITGMTSRAGEFESVFTKTSNQ